MIKTYYTIQHKDAYKIALEKGYLEGNKDYLCDESFKESYKWMKEQYNSKIRNCDEELVWLWIEEHDDERLRKSYDNFTEEYVYLEVELDENSVLLSDFESWHFVLNNWFLAVDEQEDELFDKGELNITKEDSWQRIFNIDDDSEVQGVTGEINIKNIKRLI